MLPLHQMVLQRLVAYDYLFLKTFFTVSKRQLEEQTFLCFLVWELLKSSIANPKPIVAALHDQEYEVRYCVL
jgi:hypothetical protein